MGLGGEPLPGLQELILAQVESHHFPALRSSPLKVNPKRRSEDGDPLCSDPLSPEQEGMVGQPSKQATVESTGVRDRDSRSQMINLQTNLSRLGPSCSSVYILYLYLPKFYLQEKKQALGPGLIGMTR